MANINRPRGFTPVRHLNGAPFNGATQMYYVPSTDTTAYAVGDLVKLVGTTNSEDFYNYGCPIVTRAAAGNTPLLGAIVGFKADPNNLVNSGFRQNPSGATAGFYVWVADAPDLIFEAQLCGASGAAVAPNVTAAAGTNYIGLNASIYAPTATSNFGSGLSGMMVDSSTAATTNTLALKILNYSRRMDQDLTTSGNYAKVDVLINAHLFSNASVAGI